MIVKDKIARFEDMPVWQDAQDFAVLIYELTKSFPKDELYSLTNQMRRAASSVSANIAEGFGRNTSKDHANFYRIAYGSLLETKNFIYLSKRLGYIESEVRFVSDVENLQKQIQGIIKYFKQNEKINY